MTTAVAFFHEHAGWSYDPAKETPEHGRMRCAESLAAAERWLQDQVHEIEWIGDMDADRSFLEPDDGRELYGCLVLVFLPHECKKLRASLWGIDLGPDGDDDDYRRVVEAELALELMV